MINFTLAFFTDAHFGHKLLLCYVLQNNEHGHLIFIDTSDILSEIYFNLYFKLQKLQLIQIRANIYKC